MSKPPFIKFRFPTLDPSYSNQSIDIKKIKVII